jgi:hypothetical protein
VRHAGSDSGCAGSDNQLLPGASRKLLRGEAGKRPGLGEYTTAIRSSIGFGGGLDAKRGKK